MSKRLRRFRAADLILVNGATYAKWLKTASLPKSKMVDTSRSFAADYIEIKDDAVHSHGPEGEHSHAGTAFTTWLDLRQAARQAEAVLQGLSRLLPDHQDTFGQRYAELKQELLTVGRTPEFPGSAAARAAVACLASRLPVFRQALRLESAERAVGARRGAGRAGNGRNCRPLWRRTRPRGCCGKASPCRNP